RRFRSPNLAGVFDLRPGLGVAADTSAGLLHRLPVHGRARDRPQDGVSEPSSQSRTWPSVFIRDRTALRILLPVPLGPPSLHAGSGPGSGTACWPDARLGYATR